MAAFSCDYDIEEIKDLGYTECLAILDDNDIDIKALEELEELQDLIVKNLQLSRQCQNVEAGVSVPEGASDDSHISYTSSADLMNKIISRDHEIKVKLKSVYDDLTGFFQMSQYTSDRALQHELEIEFRNVQKMVDEYSEELMNNECPIVVTGETSAGKSTLLNLLLGSKILPSSLRSNTSTVCRLYNNKQKEIKVFDKSGENVVHREMFENDVKDEVLRQALQEYVSCADKSYKYVDILWPMPFLGDQVIIVDTPGVGENSEMTSRLMDYLPKAVAFIYVINSENAGGVQQDRLLRIIEVQKQWREDGRKQTFDHNCTLFVCNKWDEVPEQERDKVWNNTKEKLRCWPGFTESQMFKLSALEAERRYTNGLDYTDDFKLLLKGIEQMVPATFQEKVKQHAWWQEKLLKKIMFHVTARINNTRLSQEEKRAKKERVEERLRRLECDTEEVKKKLKDEAKENCDAVSNKLYAYIHDPETVNQLKQWDSRVDIPKRESDLSLIEHEAKEKILAKVGQQIKQWCEAEQPSNITVELAIRFKEEYRLLEEQCQEIDNVVQDASRSLEMDGVDEEVDEPSYRIPLFAGKEKLALVLTAPLWVPLMALALTLATPVMGVIAIKDNLNEKQIRKKYLDNKEAFMNKWADEVLSKITLKAISTKLEMTYLEKFHACLDQLCDIVIPQQIQSDRELIDNIQGEERRSSAIRRQYQPLERRCQVVTGKLLLVQMEYFYEDKIVNKNITKGTCLGKGSFARVYQAEVIIEDQPRQAALKCMTEPLEVADSYSQLTEVTTLLKLSHGWIVKMYGISYEEINSLKYLQIIMELCDCPLSSQIFPGNDGSPAPVVPCSHFHPFIDDAKPSLDFFKGVSMDVCKGLVYIHKKNFIHRDLKPGNILLQNGRAKIADLGLTKELDLITGTLTGTPCYVAPEVIRMKLYSTEVDIYSFGILLWEMWYGAKAYENDGIVGYAILEQVKSGHRPGFNIRNVPPPSLQKLMKQCWHEDGKSRPQAGEVFDRLKTQFS
ncbi:LOW QUALITY PROTEIN: uncharacterized protein LOC117341442 [Pecten maximus]|uniref:LOW QUALITY PROTEIN: uncharacterized protein LOC117341442 n=1 Tax=Pecten maximus TaxID=6579 RepID=UPI00145851BE|nr:LOW QUALITY PROTEIN: uncharacterized protein LOC117341442 [Pecten maximus]